MVLINSYLWFTFFSKSKILNKVLCLSFGIFLLNFWKKYSILLLLNSIIISTHSTYFFDCEWSEKAISFTIMSVFQLTHFGDWKVSFGSYIYRLENIQKLYCRKFIIRIYRNLPIVFYKFMINNNNKNWWKVQANKPYI